MNVPIEPTKEQIDITENTPDSENPNKGNPPTDEPRINPVQCYSEGRYYNVGQDICYHHVTWRCGSSGQWFATGTHCNPKVT